MTTDFSGTWRSGRSEGWPELLDALAIPEDKLPAGLTITQVITQTGNKISIQSSNNFDETVLDSSIVVGEAYSDRAAGRDFEYATAWDDGGKLVLTQTNGEGGITRELVDGDEMLVTYSYQGVVAKSYFTKK